MGLVPTGLTVSSSSVSYVSFKIQTYLAWNTHRLGVMVLIMALIHYSLAKGASWI